MTGWLLQPWLSSWWLSPAPWPCPGFGKFWNVKYVHFYRTVVDRCLYCGLFHHTEFHFIYWHHLGLVMGHSVTQPLHRIPNWCPNKRHGFLFQLLWCNWKIGDCDRPVYLCPLSWRCRSIRQSILSLVVFFVLGLLSPLITNATQKAAANTYQANREKNLALISCCFSALACHAQNGNSFVAYQSAGQHPKLPPLCTIHPPQEKFYAAGWFCICRRKHLQTAGTQKSTLII